MEGNWQASDNEPHLGNNSPGNEKPERDRILPQYLAVKCPRRRLISFAEAILWPDRHNRSDFRCSAIGKNVIVTSKDSCSGQVFSRKAEGMPALA